MSSQPSMITPRCHWTAYPACLPRTGPSVSVRTGWDRATAVTQQPSHQSTVTSHQSPRLAPLSGNELQEIGHAGDGVVLLLLLFFLLLPCDRWETFQPHG